MNKRTKRQMMILVKATDVFIKKGFMNTVMDDIAKESDITRRTLYRYFKTKEEIGYETMLSIMKIGIYHCKGLYINVTGSGIEQLEEFLYGMVNFMEKRPDIMRYLGEFDFYFHGSAVDQSLEGKAEEYYEVLEEISKLIGNLIAVGIGDGTIDPIIDANKIGATIFSVIWGYGYHFACKEEIKKEGYKRSDLIRIQIKVYLKALENVSG